MNRNDEALERDAVSNLTLYFIMGDKSCFVAAKKLIEDNFEQIQEGDSIRAIYDWFKKFRGDYRSEENAVSREFSRWFKIKQ